MQRQFLLGAGVIATTAGLICSAFAGAADYAFEPVAAEVKKGDDAIVAVRLVHKPSGKSVSDAVIFLTRIDMGPEGMKDMASQLTPMPSPELGVYAFKTELAMAGRWLFSIAAKVQGEPETVVGKVTFKAIK